MSPTDRGRRFWNETYSSLSKKKVPTRYIRAIPPGFLVKKEHRKGCRKRKSDRSIPYEERTSGCRGEGQQFDVNFPEEGSGDLATYRIAAAARPQARVQSWLRLEASFGAEFRIIAALCMQLSAYSTYRRRMGKLGNSRCSFTGGSIRLEMVWASERWSQVSPTSHPGSMNTIYFVFKRIQQSLENIAIHVRSIFFDWPEVNQKLWISVFGTHSGVLPLKKFANPPESGIFFAVNKLLSK